MKKTVSMAVLASLCAAGSAYGSAYRIPEQSLDATSKAAANVATANGPDAAFYNPANMSWADDVGRIELGLTFIHLTQVDYEDFRSPTLNGSSEEENFLLPTIFAVSPDYHNFRVGFSITTPYGLAKRWEDPFPRQFAEKFELKTFDINPTISYKINEMVSVAAGVRGLYSDAAAVMNASPDAFVSFEGDSIDWGWNAAVSVRPTEKSNISVTYRSNIELSLDGDADLMAGNGAVMSSTGAETDSFPAPAVLTVAASYTFEKLTVELLWDRTFWSEYEDMNLTFDQMNTFWAGVFGLPRERGWDDASSYRLGLEYQLNDKWELMAGLAYDENPIPDESIDFSLPDSEGYIISLGARYQFSDKLEMGLGGVYGYEDPFKITNESLNGEFDNSAVLLLSAGFTYTF